MSSKKLVEQLTVTLINNPPRPASGDGEVIFPIGNSPFEAVLKWEKGQVVRASSNSSIVNTSDPMTMDINMTTTEGAIVCYKCWVDTDTGAWICLPTAC